MTLSCAFAGFDCSFQLFCVLTDFGISKMYSEDAGLVKAFKVVTLSGASIVYDAPEVVTRLRARTDCIMELAFAGVVYISE